MNKPQGEEYRSREAREDDPVLLEEYVTSAGEVTVIMKEQIRDELCRRIQREMAERGMIQFYERESDGWPGIRIYGAKVYGKKESG